MKKTCLLYMTTHLCLVVLIAGLSAHGRAWAEKLVYSSPSNVGPLNPHLYSPNQMFGQALLYEPLVKYDGDGRIIPWLAESWHMEPDGLAWVFQLRKGVRFSDGMAFNALAVKKNIDAVLKNAKRHAWLELIALIREVQAPEEYTVRIVLKRPYYPILSDLSLIRPFRFISPSAIPPSGNTADGITAPIGTGPFKLVKTRLGEFDLFERNNAYWGKKPGYEALEVRVISDPNTCAMAFEAGELDLIYGEDQISLDTLNRFRQDPRYTASVSRPLAFRNLAVNSNNGPTRELNVRRALQHAVNKDAIVKGIFAGTAKKVDTLLPDTLPYCDLGLEPYNYDPARAQAYLDEAGWKKNGDREFRSRNGHILTLDLCFIGNNVIQKSLSEVIQSQLRRIGIKVVLRGVEQDLFTKLQKTGDFNLIFNDTWGAPYEPHAYCGSMRVPSHGDYQTQAGLPMKDKIDHAITLALNTLDETERQKAYRYILTTLHEQAVYMPVCSINGILVHGKRLSNATFGATQYEIPFEQMRLEGDS